MATLSSEEESVVPTSDPSLFATIARLLEAEEDTQATLEQITALATRTVGCDHASITLLHGRREVETAAASHEVVRKADGLQYDLGEGPCLQAIWSHDTFVVEDMERDPRWPRWGPTAAELGLRSMLAVRLFTSGTTHGALNLYATEPRKFDADDVALAHVYATHASVALAAARHEDHLRRAIDARHLIGQAQGILMERFDIDADRAFAVLRRYSQDCNIKLRTIAEQVVSGRDLPAQVTEDAPQEA